MDFENVPYLTPIEIAEKIYAMLYDGEELEVIAKLLEEWRKG